MRVGIYDPYLDDLGGGEKYMVKIAQCLSDGHDVSVFWDRDEDLDELRNRFIIDISKIKLVKNIFSKSTSFFKRLSESRGYDLIIILSDGSIPFLLSKKTFLHIQQPFPQKNVNFKTKIKLKKIAGVFCNSYYTKSYIDKSFEINSSVLYPPVDLKPKNIKKENIILHVGRFRVKNVKVGGGDYKKQDFMISAFRKLSKEIKNWKFVLAVSIKKENEGEFEKLKQMAKGFPIEFVINKNNEELWRYYSKAKIYWHASGFGEDLEKHPEFAEHFGISTVEAMGAGVVPVVINAGGQKEIIQDGESGYLWNTEEELIGKTEKLINNKDLMGKMSEEARKRALFFAGDRFCSDLSKILKI